MVRVAGRRKGKDYSRVLDFHPCTDEEYDEFYPVRKAQAGMLRAMREDPERGLFCIDWDNGDPVELVGYEFDDDYTRLEVLLVPCNYVHTLGGYRGDSVHPGCVGDQ